MSNKSHPNSQHQPNQLTAEDIESLKQVIMRFFETYDLPYFQQLLREILTTALNGNAIDGLDGKDVGEMVVFYWRLEEVVEAVYIVNDKQAFFQNKE
jgi:hypothetical protein